MSLILDALKKSEAERRRGLPPNLHAQFGTPRRPRRAPWAMGAGAVLLMAGLGGSWFFLARDQAAPTSEPTGAALAGVDQKGPAGLPNPQSEADIGKVAAPPPSPAAVSAAVAAVAPVPTRATAEAAFGGVSGDGNGGTVSGGGLPVPQRADLYTPTVSPTTMVASQPLVEPVATPPSAPVAVPAVPDVLPEPVAASGTASAAAVAMVTPPAQFNPATADLEAAKPEEKLPLMYELPYSMRKELPKLDLTMHVFSPAREERFIVLNGKRFTVDSPAPGPELTLLDIVADGVVLEFRGQRFLLPNQAY
ncbi:MAG: general secretion pathway protein GspB [Lysobacterales bacterium]